MPSFIKLGDVHCNSWLRSISFDPIVKSKNLKKEKIKRKSRHKNKKCNIQPNFSLFFIVTMNNWYYVRIIEFISILEVLCMYAWFSLFLFWRYYVRMIQFISILEVIVVSPRSESGLRKTVSSLELGGTSWEEECSR